MSSADIQDVVDARVASVMDDYMDDDAIRKLRQDLMNDVHAQQVHVWSDYDSNKLFAKVTVGPHEYASEVALSKRVVRLVVSPPMNTFGEIEIKSDLPEDVRKDHAERHAAKVQEKNDAEAKALADAQADAQAEADKNF